MAARTSVTEGAFDSAVRRPAKSDSENDRLWNGKRPLPSGNRAESSRAQHVRSTSIATVSIQNTILSLRAISGLTRRSKRALLFDHLVGASEHNLSVTDQPTTISLIWICGEISV